VTFSNKVTRKAERALWQKKRIVPENVSYYVFRNRHSISGKAERALWQKKRIVPENVSYYMFRNRHSISGSEKLRKEGVHTDRLPVCPSVHTGRILMCLFVRPSLLAEYLCDLRIGVVELNVMAAICGALARLVVRAKCFLSFLPDTLFVSYVIHVVWS
jgi:hypothetical protein